MSICVYKVLTGEGVAFVAYQTVIDQFVTSALPSALALAEEIGEDVEYCSTFSPAQIFNFWPRSLDRIALCLYRLRSGEPLKDDDACLLDKFHSFLRATIAHHQYVYLEIADNILEGWIDELGLRKGRYADWDAHDIAHDGCMFRVIHDAALARRYHSCKRNLKPTSVAQRKMTGRYLTKLAQISNLLGPGRTSPIKVIDDCFKMSMTREPGT